MKRKRKTRLPAIALGLGVLLPAAIAAPGWYALADDLSAASATAKQIGSAQAVRHDEPQSRLASGGEVGGRVATPGSHAARYENLDEAWQAIRSDGARLGAATAADWQMAMIDADRDWSALTEQWRQFVAN